MPRLKIPRPGPTRNKIPRPDPKIFLKLFPDPGPGFGLVRGNSGFRVAPQVFIRSNTHWKPQVNHLSHLSHSVSLHGQKNSFFTHFWVILSMYWPTVAQMSQMIHSGFSVQLWVLRTEHTLNSAVCSQYVLYCTGRMQLFCCWGNRGGYLKIHFMQRKQSMDIVCTLHLQFPELTQYDKSENNLEWFWRHRDIIMW